MADADAEGGERRGAAAPYVFAIAVGIALWFGASLLGGRREAWDSPLYWSFAYPLSMVAAALIGHLWPKQPGRVVLALFAGQFIAMCLRNGEIGNLWPLGLAMFGLLSLPAIAVAFAVARFLPRRP
jgi:hypothetical protein